MRGSRVRHTPRLESRWTVVHPFFYTMKNRGPEAPRRQGKVARAICPRPDCGSVEKRKKKKREVEREGTHKNQTPKALPSWHASTSQPLSLNRITSRGLRRDFSLYLILRRAARRSLLLLFFSLRSSTSLKSHAREAALFLELVLFLLLGSTCRHHHGVFVPRMPRAIRNSGPIALRKDIRGSCKCIRLRIWLRDILRN